VGQRLFTIRDIVEILNKDLQRNDVEYRYTEQSVRSRLRYLRSKGVEDRAQPVVMPKTFGYDKRTKYYSEEDVEKLRSIWIGPMLAEFHDYPEDLPILEEVDEIEVRPATDDDIEALAELPRRSAEAQENETANTDMRDRASKMLKEPNSKTFVAFSADGKILGWAQAKIEFGQSLAQGDTVGAIHFYVSLVDKLANFALRSLIHRAQRWLDYRDAKHSVLVIQASMAGFEQYLHTIFLPDSTELVVVNAPKKAS
jgi:hypothetical protein